MVLSHDSLALFMGIRLVSVVGEFLAMTFFAFLVVIDIHRACCSDFAVTVIPAFYIDLSSHSSPCGLYRHMYLAGTFLPSWRAPNWG